MDHPRVVGLYVETQIDFDINIWYISFLLGKFDFPNPRGWGGRCWLGPLTIPSAIHNYISVPS
jgi:hypothetical protein